MEAHGHDRPLFWLPNEINFMRDSLDTLLTKKLKHADITVGIWNEIFDISFSPVTMARAILPKPCVCV